MPGYHVSLAITGMGSTSELYVSERPGHYRRWYKRQPYVGFPDLPADDYVRNGQVVMSIQELLVTFGDKDYAYGSVYQNYDGGLDLHLFKRGAVMGGCYRLILPAEMPDYAEPLQEGDIYPRPIDWWLATRKLYSHEVPADYVNRTVRAGELRLAVREAQPMHDEGDEGEFESMLPMRDEDEQCLYSL